LREKQEAFAASVRAGTGLLQTLDDAVAGQGVGVDKVGPLLR
jgi:hypothetical protein